MNSCHGGNASYFPDWNTCRRRVFDAIKIIKFNTTGHLKADSKEDVQLMFQQELQLLEQLWLCKNKSVDVYQPLKHWLLDKIRLVHNSLK